MGLKQWIVGHEVASEALDDTVGEVRKDVSQLLRIVGRLEGVAEGRDR